MVISLVGMRFHVRVGILPHERVHPQPLEIDVTVTRAPNAHGVLDYRSLYALAAEHVTQQPLDYLEDVATSVAEGALMLADVIHARVAVRKLHVMLDGPLAYAEVVVERGHG
ncbi:MAG TPA: dihydroneopterin aldolase [Gemmatimonadaceae bacterium]|nr:dihydroneopterin aldolase [Gemmatimonadaceae bacterium]